MKKTERFFAASTVLLMLDNVDIVPPGFEPGSPAPEAGRIGHYPRGLLVMCERVKEKKS